MSAVTGVRVWVDVDEDEEHVEGNYWAPAVNGFSLAPSDESCPFCFAPLQLIRSAYFGRIVKDEQERKNGQTSAIVQLLPTTHDALMCSGCETVFTIPKDRQE
jgi:hypothetical protein